MTQEQKITEPIEVAKGLAVHFSSPWEEWLSPKPIVDAAAKVLGHIDLDPAAEAHDLVANVPALCHYTKEDDGLARPWDLWGQVATVYLNPPYGRDIGKWMEKLHEEWFKGRIAAFVAFVPARTDTAWWQTLMSCSSLVCFVSCRLHFSGVTIGAPLPSAVAYGGLHGRRFGRVFCEFGWIYEQRLPHLGSQGRRELENMAESRGGAKGQEEAEVGAV